MAGAATTDLNTLFTSGLTNTPSAFAASGQPYNNIDGFDLVWSQQYLQSAMATAETNINNIEQNANLSDTEKMFSMQMAMNTWSSIANLRTNMLKSVSDTLKAIGRNIN